MKASAAHSPQSWRAGSARLHTVDLAGPEGRLEAVVNEGAANAPFTALICHPHPKGGGTLHNKVVYYAMKALNAPSWGLEWPVLRFNFRGIGRSEGTHDGKAEAEDVLAGRDWLEDQYGLPVVLVGFSFGAAMALRAAKLDERGIYAVAALGLPTHAEGREYHYSFLKEMRLPKLFLSGESDEYASEEELARVVVDAAEPKRLILLPRADHFFRGQMEPMQQALGSWMKELIP